MGKKVRHYLFQAISFIFVAYGFYLLFLFLLDTMLRINKPLAYPLSVMVTFILIGFTLLYWLKKKRLPL